MAANYLHLPGVVGNYTFVPGIASLDGSGTLEFIAKVALDDWTPDANQVWISKWTGSAGYLFYLESASNDLKLIWRDSGPARIAQATVTPTVTDGDWLWVRAVATEDGVDRDVFFYTSTDETNNPDEVSWTQLGAEVVVPFGGGDLVTNTAVVFVGAQSNTAATMAGSIAAARVNFAGVTELDIDFSDLTAAEVDAGSFTEDSGNAATVTIAGNEWTYVRLRTLEDYPKVMTESIARTLYSSPMPQTVVDGVIQNPVPPMTYGPEYLAMSQAEFVARKDLLVSLGVNAATSVLIVGCGYGSLIKVMADAGLTNVYGLEPGSWIWDNIVAFQPDAAIRARIGQDWIGSGTEKTTLDIMGPTTFDWVVDEDAVPAHSDAQCPDFIAACEACLKGGDLSQIVHIVSTLDVAQGPGDSSQNWKVLNSWKAIAPLHTWVDRRGNVG